MNLPELCIRRPVMTTLLMVSFIFFGAVAYTALPVAELPKVDFPTIAVNASLPGASPETMATSVAAPLEAQFSTIDGVESMTSVSALGATRITLQFALDRNIDAAAQDVQSAISASLRKLPTEMPTPPTLRKVNPSDFAIFIIAMSSSTLPLSTVDDYGQNILAQRISSIHGVAQVQVWGSQKYAVRVQVNPDALAYRGIGIDEVGQAIQRANVNMPTGTLDGAYQTMTIQSTGQLQNAQAFSSQVVAYRNGAPVRFEEIGRVIDSVESNKVASWHNGERAIILGIYRQPGTNTIDIVDSIKRIMPAIQQGLPVGIQMETFYDRSITIRDSIHEVQFTLVLAAALVVLVIFLFLKNVSTTLVASVALPISIVGTFAAVYALGYSLNNLTLLALTLAVGFVVDDAIVMLENIVRHIEKGEKPMAAALKGAREIGFTILSMTLSLAAVFIPLVFMRGIVGRLLHEFAVTICAAILVSGFVSITLTPMMCSRFIRGTHGKQQAAFYRAIDWAIDGTRNLYDRSLRWTLRHNLLMAGVFVMTLAGTGYFYTLIQKDFLPSEDTGRIIAFTEGAQDTSFEAMIRNQQVVAAIALKDPNIDAVMSSVGVGGARTTPNAGTMFMRLKPRTERTATPDQVIQQLRPKLQQVPGLNVFLQNPPAIRVGGQLSKAPYQYVLQDIDFDVLTMWADKLLAGVRGLPGFRDVTTNLDLASPNLVVNIDRNRAATLGITAEQVELALGSAFGSRQVSTIYTPSSQYQVILEVEPKYQRDASALSRLHVRSAGGGLVPLDAVTSVKRDIGPLTVNHLGQLPAVTISFGLDPELSIGTAIDRIRQMERELKAPPTLATTFQGTAQAFQESFRGMGLLLALAIVVVYIVLGILYESFIHPLTILSGLPSAGLGALLTLWAFGANLDLYAFVGVIMLVGIVKKNAIMMIDFALEKQRTEGRPPAEAIYEACLIRFRPIMMTTMAALMGTLPIALAYGAGSEARRPLGLAVVGGLIVSQLLTLYITPTIYIYLDRLQRAMAGQVKHEEGAEGAPRAGMAE
ncbi:MAG: efflux RND transporter permease subunit [Rhodospirillales bacterium]|nr:efflux RND transporter permease subunit [Rhodospirillales bacterium]